MYYKVTHFEKNLHVESTKPYGVITVYFGSKKSSWSSKRISLTKFMALAHILENDVVGYNPKIKIFETPIESSKFIEAPKKSIV